MTCNTMIAINTDDWTNEPDTLYIGRMILGTGVRGILRYKPDIYTAVGIFRNNLYKVKPTVYALGER